MGKAHVVFLVFGVNSPGGGMVSCRRAIPRGDSSQVVFVFL